MKIKRLLLLLSLSFIPFLSIQAATGTPPGPVITSFSPASGPIGTLVTITGTGLYTPTRALSIGGVPAILISTTGSTQLVAMVMPGARTGLVSITTFSGNTTGPSNFTVTLGSPPYVQQGAKLVGSGYAGTNSYQGHAVALSADGNTAIVGGNTDDTYKGAAWIYVRTASGWAQQGDKLVSPNAIGNAQQGTSVAISADGNTVIVGGAEDDNGRGSAWIYTRSGTTWTEQTNLVGTGAIGNARQGSSVSLSADGNTALVGGSSDDAEMGAVWIFTRSGGTWTQQSKLVGTGSTRVEDNENTMLSPVNQGCSAALSADGSTAIVGGNGDDSGIGAVWIFTLSASIWTQQGSKLVGTAAVGTGQQGISVAISADGNTVISGGGNDNGGLGAVWIFTRDEGAWIQQGSKLVGTGNQGSYSTQGHSVALSADGNIALVGGEYDNTYQGATWVFGRTGTSWTQQGNKLVGTGGSGSYFFQGYSVALSANGTTALVGGNIDNDNIGAAWVFVNYLGGRISVPPNGTYNYNQNLDFTFTYPETVTVNTSGGIPYIPLTLNTGGTVQAAYVSGSGTSSLVFRYTIKATDQDDDGIALGDLISLNGGTIKYSTDVDADLSLRDKPSTQSILVSNPAPLITNFNPNIGHIGTSVTINGSYLSNVTEVKIGTVSLPFIPVNAQKITFILPIDAITGKISVSTVSGTVTSTGDFTVDNTTLAPSLTSPAISAQVSSPLTIAASLPEAPLSGSIQLTFTSNTGQIIIWTLKNSLGAINFSINPDDPASNPNVVSATPPPGRIPEGVYSVKLSYQDAVGNPVASVTNTNVVFTGTVTEAPTLSSPATESTVGTSLTVSAVIPEAVLTSSLKLTFTPASGTPIVWTLKETVGAINFTINPNLDPTLSSYIKSATSTAIPEGIYTVSLSYQDQYSNPIATATSTNVNFGGNITLAPTLSSPASSSTVGALLTVAGLIPETALANSIRLTFTPKIGPAIYWTLNDPPNGVLNFSVNPNTDPALNADVSSASSTSIPKGMYTVSLSYQDQLGNPTASVTSTNVNFVGFNLPANNFRILGTNESCRSSNNGKIEIAATQTTDYGLRLIKDGTLFNTYTFTNNLDINNLSAGLYTLCMSVANQPDYQQCFTISIEEPQDLAVLSEVNSSNNMVTLSLQGATTYLVTLNETTFSTNQTQLTLNLQEGENKVRVETAQSCQGVYEQEIFVSGRVLVYPNPFKDLLYIKLKNQADGMVTVSVSNTSGLTVYQAAHLLKDNTILLDLSSLDSGLYFLQIGNFNYKILKK